MDDLITLLTRQTTTVGSVALASLVDSSGSIPMSERAKMFVCADGSAQGTIGGGCLEAEIHTVAREVLETGQPQTTDYTMTEQRAGEHGLNCGGTVRIYTERIDAQSGQLYGRIAAAKEARQACVLLTVLGGDDRLLYHADGRSDGGLPDVGESLASEWARTALNRGQPFLETTPEGREVFVEPFAPPPVLYVFGGGHVGGHICRLAKSVGFHVVVIDDRPYFANHERHPEADDCIADEVEAVFARIRVDEQTYIVAATRGHQHDEIVVEHAIRTPARYVGMLGSERKKLTLWKRIEARGGSREQLDAVYSPVGLNIGADTPEEIAVSVVGELIQVRRGAPRKPWKTKRSGVGG